MKTLLLCTLLLQAEVPPPVALEALYQQAIPCVAEAPARPARVPAGRLNDYFVGSRKVWPVLSLAELEMLPDERIKALTPGLLLEDLSRMLGDRKRQRQLRQFARLGARPVAVLDKPTPQHQRDQLMAWCSLGVCPQAFYLPRGASQRLADLLPATYLSAPWMVGVPEWPLPHRQLEIAGRQLLPALPAGHKASGQVAQLGLLAADVASFSPQLMSISWKVGGIQLRLVQGKLESGLPGLALMQLYRVSLTLWPALSQGYTPLALWASTGFAWFILVLMVVNLVWLGGALWRYQHSNHQLQKGRRHGSG